MKRLIPLTLAASFAIAPISPAAAAAVQDPSTMTEEEKINLAKTYYLEAEAAFKAEDYATATNKYEEAYFLVPGKHGFAYKVGTAAWAMGDCAKADEYFRHYVTYETRESKAEQIAEAKRVLGEIAIQGCATPAEEPAAAATTAPAEQAAVPEDDGPDLTSSRDKRAAAGAEEVEEKPDREKKFSPMMTAGIGLSAVGVVGLAAGVTGLIVGNSAAKTLIDESSNNTASGFPSGQYGSDNSNLDKRVDAMNIMSVVGFSVGGALVATGATLIALDIVKSKKAGGAAPAETAGLKSVGPMWMSGGGGASASFRF